jgi:hypothetical protein
VIVEPVKSSLGSQVATAVIFIAIVGGIVLAARHASQPPPEDEDTGIAATPEPPGPVPNPLTPESARSARELHAALAAKFGKNARGQAFFTLVDYDGHPDRLHLSFPLDESDVVAPTAKASGLKRVRDVLAAVRGTRMHWTWVLLTATAPARDELGGVSETTVIRIQVLRNRLNDIDWARFTGNDVQGIAEQFWLHPDLSQPVPAETPAATRPAAQ